MHHPMSLMVFLIWLFSACIVPLHAEPAPTPPPDAGEAIPMRLAAIHKGDVVYVQGLSRLAKSIEESSGKKIRPELLTNGKMGAEDVALQELLAGNLEGGFFSPLTLARQVSAFRALVTPRLFIRPEQVRGLMGSPLDTALREVAKGKNLFVLGYGSYGFYGVLNFRAAASGAAGPVLSALPARVPNDPWMIEVHQAMGLQPSSMPAADLTEAITSGWIQGIAATPEMLHRTAFANANAKAFHQTRQLHGWMVLVVHREWFEKLPRELQEGIIGAASTVLPQAMEQAFSQEKKILDKWATEFHIPTLTPGDQDAALLKNLSQKSIQECETLLNQPGVVAQAHSFNQGPPAPPKRDTSGKSGDSAKSKKSTPPSKGSAQSTPGSEPATKARSTP
ncbi:MAG: TRAP transporter substrate-binding protein DctP [Magnetococcales bacterium]|nr:TRAP transporter substrate-binding protein DctP [Magnetococcales bacterium]